jgi:biopolymer transport protein ExbD
MSFALSTHSAEPMSELNTTPLIDIMLVLLIMLIFTLPPITNSVELPLPAAKPVTPLHPDRLRNVVAVAADDTILWNGNRVSEGQLEATLGLAVALKPEPELQLVPDGRASYEMSARVLRLVKLSGASKIGFVGNERYRAFERRAASLVASPIGLDAHRRPRKRLGLEQQLVVDRSLRQALAADHHQHRDGERADPVELHVDQPLGRAVEQVAEPADVGHPRPGVGPGGFDQHVVWFILAQNVVDQVGREGHLLAALALARMLPLNQPGDHRHLAERAAQDVRFLNPFEELVAENVGREQRRRVLDRPQPPNR